MIAGPPGPARGRIMNMKKISWAAAATLFALTARAGDWPQWRGPHFNGSADETGLPSTWSRTENVRWIAPLPGRAASTPVVWNDRVFLTALDTGRTCVVNLCLDTATGRTRWENMAGGDRRLGAGNTVASPSPVTDGRKVVFIDGNARIAAFDMDGGEQWKRDLEKDFGPFLVKFGYSSSPLLYDGRLYVAVFQNAKPGAYGRGKDLVEPVASFLLALDPGTGRTLWKHERDTDAQDESREAYITPMPFEFGGRREILLPVGECISGHDAATGAEIWRWWFQPPDRKIWQRMVPCAVPGEGLVYVARPKHRPLFAIRAGGSGTLAPESEAWRISTHMPDVTTPLLYQGHLYALHDSRRTLGCLDARTGAAVWEATLEGQGPIRASPTGADGKVYIVDEAGEVFVFSAAAPGALLHRFATGEKPCHSTIAAARGCLFIRTASNLWCIGAAK
jgi:outer membrane protein assembly factor BamB